MCNHKRVIVWRITQNCNMNCLFCSYSNELERKRDVADNADILRFLKILGEYENINNQEILISWIGGEPFLWEQIIPFSREIRENCGINISATTNGLLLFSKELREEIINYFSEIVISLDGFSQCNDRVRKYNVHYEKIIENIVELSKEKNELGKDLIIKVNTILMRENIEMFEEFCCKLADIGVNELTFNQLGGFDRPEFYQDNRLLDYQVKRFSYNLVLLKEKFNKMGLRIHGSNNYLQRIISSTENKKIAIDECYPGKWFWFINENGFISPCSYTSYEYMLHINSIKQIEDIDTIENSFKDLRKTKRSQWCNDCHCTQLYDKFE